MQSELKTHSIETTVSKLIKIHQKAMEVPDFFGTYGGWETTSSANGPSPEAETDFRKRQRFGVRGDGAP